MKLTRLVPYVYDVDTYCIWANIFEVQSYTQTCNLLIFLIIFVSKTYIIRQLIKKKI